MMIAGVVGPAAEADRHHDLYNILLAIHQVVDAAVSGKKFKKVKPPKIQDTFPWLGALRPELNRSPLADKAFKLREKARVLAENNKENRDAGTS